MASVLHCTSNTTGSPTTTNTITGSTTGNTTGSTIGRITTTYNIIATHQICCHTYNLSNLLHPICYAGLAQGRCGRRGGE
jgi:hypothetical protein